MNLNSEVNRVELPDSFIFCPTVFSFKLFFISFQKLFVGVCAALFYIFAVPLGSPYYDNVRPLCYSDSDAVLLCFDISRPDTVDGALKKVGSTWAPLYRGTKLKNILQVNCKLGL